MRYLFYNVARDGEGKIITEATLNVYEAGGLVAANVYVADSGGSAVNSVTSDSTNGSYTFYVDDGDYSSDQLFKVVQSKTNYSDLTLDNIRIYPFASAGYTDDLKPQKIFGGASNTIGHTVPDIADDIFVMLAAVQTLSNKTLDLIGPLTFTESGDEYIRVPRLTTTQRNALTPTNGMLIYNTTESDFEIYAAGAWTDLVTLTHSQTLTNKTLTAPIFTGAITISGTLAGTSWPSFSAHKNGSNQTGVANSTWTKVTFGTEEFDTEPCFGADASGSNAAADRFNPGTAGKYILTAGLEFTVGVDGADIYVAIYKNNVEYKRIKEVFSDAGGLGAPIAAVVDANGSSDYYEIYTLQTTGADKIIDGDSVRTFFTGCRAG